MHFKNKSPITPKVMPFIYFDKNYHKYRLCNNIVGESKIFSKKNTIFDMINTIGDEF